MSNFLKKIAETFRYKSMIRSSDNRRGLRSSARRDVNQLRFERLEERSMLAANLVKDINPGVGTGAIDLRSYIDFNGMLIFRANDGTTGQELWKSDGTAAGTVLVKDINLGLGNAVPYYFTNVNGILYFSADNGTNGTELWRSDGTATGTVLVKDILAGSVGSNPKLLTNVNGTLFFNAEGANGAELWKSDGTSAGTVLVKDIVGGTNGSFPTSLTNVNGTLFFNASTSFNGNELWKSDGSTVGTVLVKDINNTSSSSVTFSFDPMANVNGTLYFAANDGATGNELWRSDGSASGTVMVRDINPIGSSGSDPAFLTNADGTLYFTANDGVNGVELWKSDGTYSGTALVKNIRPGSSSSNSNPNNLVNIAGDLFFRAIDGTNGFELWKSDGTATGTSLVKDIRLGSLDSSINNSFVTQGKDVKGWFVFNADDGVNGKEVWVSDGASLGTRLLADIVTGANGSSPNHFVQVGSQLFFTATTPSTGGELWSIPLPPYSIDNGIVTIDLSNSTSNRTLSVRTNAGLLTIFDLTTNTEFLGPNSEFPITTNAIKGLRIIGSNTFSENIVIDHAAGGVVDLPKGFEFDGGAGIDTVSIIGASGVDGTISQTSPDTIVTSGSGVAGVTLKYRNVESLTMTSFGLISAASNLLVDSPISISNQLPFGLANRTTLAGATLTATGLVSLGSGEAIVGSGGVAGRFAGESGSAILASGNMTIGNSSSVAGFLTRGELDAGTSTVTLLDSNQAVLGSLTSLGNATTIGTLVAANGALIDFGNNLIGYGTLSTPNLVAKQTTINGIVEGTSAAQPVTLAGYIKGVGSLNNVSVTGTYSPGFSPAAVTLGNVSYAASSVTVIELGGTVPGTEHDQLNHVGQAILGGTLDLELINGYQPVLGNSFTFLTATAGVSGTFANTILPTLSSGLQWQITYNAQTVVASVIQSNVAPTGLSLSNTNVAENSAANSVVGVFTTTDANAGDTHTYSLVAGTGSTDNATFSVSGNQLKANPTFDFETKSSYSIRVRTTDALGLFFEQTFTITISDVNESVVLTRANASVTGNVLTQLSNTGTWSDPESGAVTLSASLGTVTKHVDGTWSWTHTPSVALLNQVVTISASDGTNVSNVTFSVTAYTTIATRGIQYVGATGTSASTSLATDKVPLLPGQSSTFANYSNYSRGLNGLVIDVAGLPASVTNSQLAASMQFANWDGIAAAGFVALPGAAVPTVAIVAGGVSGSTRVLITFPDNTLQNTWLRVTVVANADTALAANDVFYFGNVLGDFNVDNTATRIRVNELDTSAVRNNQSTGANSVGVTNIYDVNRDGRVNALDTSFVRNNQQSSGIVAPITAPSSFGRSGGAGLVGQGDTSQGGTSTGETSQAAASQGDASQAAASQGDVVSVNGQMPSGVPNSQSFANGAVNPVIPAIGSRLTGESYNVPRAALFSIESALPFAVSQEIGSGNAILPEEASLKKRLSELQPSTSQLDTLFACLAVEFELNTPAQVSD